MKKSTLLLGGICGVALVAFAGLSRKSWFKTAEKHPISHTQDSMTTSPISVQELKTNLGKSIWFVPTSIPVMSVSITFRNAGDRSSPSNLPGLTDLIAALLDEGAGPYDSQSFKKLLLEKNISLSVASSQDNFTITFRTVKENVKDALELIKLILSSPRFANEDMQRVKQQIIAGLQQSLHHPQPIAKEELQKNLLGETHPYFKRTSERIKVISTMQADQLRAQMQKNLTQANLEVVACGNIAPSELVQYLEKAFGDLPKGEPTSQPVPTKLQNLGKVFNVKLDIPQSLIFFAHPGVSRQDPDFYALYVAARILGSGNFESRLWNEIREKRGLAYFCNLDLFTNDLAHGMIGATATKTESLEETISVIRQEWKNLIEKGITQEELDFHKKNIMGSFPLSFGSTLETVNTLALYRQDDLPVDYVEKRNSYFSKLTIEDINQVIKKILHPELLTFIVVGRSEAKAEAK
jgi:zinc protease